MLVLKLRVRANDKRLLEFSFLAKLLDERCALGGVAALVTHVRVEELLTPIRVDKHVTRQS